MNTRKLFGFAAIVAVIALSMTALSLTGCPTTDNGGNLKTLSGNITISGNSGETVTTGTELTANYDGDEEVTYQWYKDGKAIEDATTDKFTPSEAGTYTVTVSVEGYTSKTSEPIEVTGESLQDLSGEVTISPTDNVTVGTELTATYDGDEEVTYQWNKNGTAIDDATEEEYTPDEAGSYTVTVKADGYKEKTSDAVTVISVFTTAPELTLEPGNGKITYTWTASEPEADNYDVYWKQGEDLTAAGVKDGGTKITGATSGGEITGLTNGTTYCVIVSANKAGYDGIDSEVETAIPSPPYYITSNGTTFTANKGSATGPAVTGAISQPIQTVIDAIRTDAAGKACIIHFGEEDGTDALNIGSSSVSFANDGTNTWGLVELGGKITSSVNTATTGTIAIADNISMTSTADIANTNTSTGTNANGRAIYYNSTGALHISGGEVKANTDVAVYNASTGKITVSGTATVTSANAISGSATVIIASSGADTAARLVIEGGTVENTANSTNARVILNNSNGAVNISGGTVQATGTGGLGITNNSNGAINISGGTVSTTTNKAVHNASTGKITVSGTAKITSANTNQYDGTISLQNASTSGDRLEITGGTVENTGVNQNAIAIFNGNNNIVNISGGTVSANTGMAVYNNVSTTSKITVSGTAKITSANKTNAADSGTICLSGGSLEIIGGTVENTDNDSNAKAVHNASTGTVTITGGTVQATGNFGRAVYNRSSGAINISGGMVKAISGNTVYNASSGNINISGGTVSAISGDTVYCLSSGTLTISGGTVSSDTNAAVNYSSSGKLTVSGTAKVTSASTTAPNGGTIILLTATGVADPRLEITGGTVENTSTDVSGNTIRIRGPGNTIISNGTVSTTATSGRAIFNDSTGNITISGGMVKAPENTTAYAIYNGSTSGTVGTVTINPAATIVGNNYGVTP